MIKYLIGLQFVHFVVVVDLVLPTFHPSLSPFPSSLHQSLPPHASLPSILGSSLLTSPPLLPLNPSSIPPWRVTQVERVGNQAVSPPSGALTEAE